MPVLLGLLAPLQAVNNVLGRFGHAFTAVAMALMVLAILIQVFFRYVLNNALPWPDEAARFMMLWMTGMIAPVAYRRGGFVAIDMLAQFLPRKLASLLTLVLLVLAFGVLIMGVQLGYKHTMSGCLFKSSSLAVPFTFEFALPIPLTGTSLTLCTKADAAFSISFGWTKIPLAMMYASIYVGFILLTIVNVELILRSLVQFLGGSDHLTPIHTEVLEAE
jgi:TRAP-type C4-dicarboxylate transport system permease small subunit